MTPLKLLKSVQCPAAVEVVGPEGEEGEVVVVAVETGEDPPQRQARILRPTRPTIRGRNLTKGVRSMQTFQPKHHGPVRNIGKKAAKLHTVATPSSASGSTS